MLIFWLFGRGACELFCCLGGAVFWFFAVRAGGVLLFAVCAGVVFNLFCCLGDGVVFFVLFGRGCVFFAVWAGDGKFARLPVCLAPL